MTLKTIQLYGGVNEDKRYRFKIDHNFDLSTIVDASVSSDGSISLHKDKYLKSEGTEFIIISYFYLKGAKSDYAVRADKYTAVREQLNKGELTAEALEKAGGFKINHSLTPGEAGTNDGWIELAVGKNRATAQDYASASGLLQRYIAEAQERGCFGGGGMGFYVETDSQDYKARSWFVSYSDGRSRALGRCNLSNFGRFLRVRQVKAAESDPKKVDYKSIANPFNTPPSGFDPALLGRALNPKGAEVLSKALAAYSAQK